jgi:hypothetical protein
MYYYFYIAGAFLVGVFLMMLRKKKVPPPVVVHETSDIIVNVPEKKKKPKNDTYDLLFKDLVVCSDRRDITNYPNPTSYVFELDMSLYNIHKAELIDVSIPAATDPHINITPEANRLYMNYNSNVFYIQTRAGTYYSAMTLCNEIQNHINNTLTTLSIEPNTLIVQYNLDYNRIVFADTLHAGTGTFCMYPQNGSIIQGSGFQYTVQNSMASILKLDTSNEILEAKSIVFKRENDKSMKLVPTAASAGDYGSVNGTNVSLTTPLSGINISTICSDTITCQKGLFMSIDSLNGTTVNMVAGTKKTPPIFCRIPTNGEPTSTDNKKMPFVPVFSAAQVYNPPLAYLRKLDVTFYDDEGNVVNLLDHSFTLRVYYFQKVNTNSPFPVSQQKYAADLVM